jgi:hypothetical protein
MSQVLAIGFLLVILSAALFHNYLTLLVVATYVIAPLPNWLCGRAANHDDFMESSGNGVVDFGRFLTGFFVVMGIGKCSPGVRVLLCAMRSYTATIPWESIKNAFGHKINRMLIHIQRFQHSCGIRPKSQEVPPPCPSSVVC